MRKLGIGNLAELINLALRTGLVPSSGSSLPIGINLESLAHPARRCVVQTRHWKDFDGTERAINRHELVQVRRTQGLAEAELLRKL